MPAKRGSGTAERYLLVEDLTEETKHQAALVMAGIAVERCDCTDPYVTLRGMHLRNCPATCGLRDVMDALALREREDEDA